jgi:hypothetical protein
MKSITHIFDPLMSMFKIDYEKRLTAMLTMDLYEARKKYINVLQAKQHMDTELAHAETRVSTLTKLLAEQKEVENDKKNSLSLTNRDNPVSPISRGPGV